MDRGSLADMASELRVEWLSDIRNIHPADRLARRVAGRVRPMSCYR